MVSVYVKNQTIACFSKETSHCDSDGLCAIVFDKIDFRKKVTPNYIYLHLRKEWTLVLRASTLLHDAS